MAEPGKEKETEDESYGPNRRSTIGWWLRFIERSKRAAELHWERSTCAYEEYEYGFVKKTEDDQKEVATVRYPAYKFACAKLEPAYYGQTPRAIARRKFGIESPLALTMAMINERLGQHEVDHPSFDECMVAARNQYIHAGKTSTQAIYTTKTEPMRVPLQFVDGDEPQYYEDGKREAYVGEVKEDEDGYFYMGQKAIDETQQIISKCVNYDEVLHTPEARTNDDITEYAYKFSMDKAEAESMFNSDGNKKLPYKSRRREDAKDTESSSESDEVNRADGEILEGWECYCKHSGMKYWVAEGFKDDFLLSEKDEQGFANFFPSTRFKIQNPHRNSLYPTPTFTYLRSTAGQLNVLYERIFSLIDGIRRRAIVIGASKELIDALNDLDGEEFVTTGQVQDILEKGGVANMIQYVPVQELVAALNEAISLEEKFNSQFNDWFGVPDILRGISNPQDAYQTNQLIADNASDRFKYDKKQMFDLARETAEMRVDLALRVYSDEKIKMICGHEFMERGRPEVPPQPPTEQNPQGVPGVPAKPSHYELFDEALRRLRNDKVRLVSIDFETDSTSFRDEAREMQRQRMVSETVTSGLQQISQMANPMFANVAAKLLLTLVDAMGGSAQAENIIKQAMDDLEDQYNNPPPPPPDVEMLKLEAQKQKLAFDGQLKGAELQMKAQDQRIEAQEKQMKMAMEAQKSQADLMKTVQEIKESQANMGMDQARFMLDKFQTQFQAMIDGALLQIEQQNSAIEAMKAKASIQESMMEEVRLARGEEREQRAQVIKAIASIQQGGQQGQAQMSGPPIHIYNEMPTGFPKRKGRIVRPDGTITEIETEDVPPGV